jgi:hypothetical protein
MDGRLLDHERSLREFDLKRGAPPPGRPPRQPDPNCPFDSQRPVAPPRDRGLHWRRQCRAGKSV